MFFSRKKFPSTEAIEQEEKQKVKLYQEFVEIQNSDVLKEYLELHEELNTDSFKSEKQKIRKIKYKKTEDFVKEKEFSKLQKNKALKGYLEIENSAELKKYIAFKASDAYKQMKDAQKRKENPELEKMYQFEQSNAYTIYKDVEGSPALKHYTELKTYLSSKEHKDYKAYCNNPDRYETTDLFKKEQRYTELSKNETLVNFLKYENTNYFDEQKNWELTFDDEFRGKSLEQDKWLKSYFWAKDLGDNLYSSGDELQAYDGVKNIKINNGLNIQTRQEKGKGKFWDSKKGFIIKETPYTSAIVSCANSFKQKEGKVKIKVKLHGSTGVQHSAWLSSPKNDQSLVLFKSSDKHVMLGSLAKTKTGINKSVDFAKKVSLYNNYYIISLEWNPKSIVWKVNDVEVKSTPNNLANHPMHLIINSVITDAKKAGDGEMIIDWVRSYSKKEA